MADSTAHALHVNGHSPSDLVSRVTDAAQFTKGMTLIQESGIARFAQLVSVSWEDLAADHLVEKLFHLFDDLFFERSLRYGVTNKVERGTLPLNTCYKGLAHGGKLPVIVGDSSSTLKDGSLGRLLHDMIHAYLWRYGDRAFTQNNIFENAWGFSGHGTAWQDIAAVLETFMKEHELLVDLGRNEALTSELEKFLERMKLLGQILNYLVATGRRLRPATSALGSRTEQRVKKVEENLQGAGQGDLRSHRQHTSRSNKLRHQSQYQHKI